MSATAHVFADSGETWPERPEVGGRNGTRLSKSNGNEGTMVDSSESNIRCCIVFYLDINSCEMIDRWVMLRSSYRICQWKQRWGENLFLSYLITVSRFPPFIIWRQRKVWGRFLCDTRLWVFTSPLENFENEATPNQQIKSSHLPYDIVWPFFFCRLKSCRISSYQFMTPVQGDEPPV